MTANEYQKRCEKTAQFDEKDAIEYLTMGLCSEAGEVAGKIKKWVLRGRTDLNQREVMLEIGDVLWYASMLSTEMGYNLEEVMANNLSKLGERAARQKIQGDGDNR